MTVHHILGPSKMDRIKKCIGSLYGPADTSSSEAAREGTACHALLEICLLMDMQPIDFLGSTQFSEEFPVTIEMVEAVDLFIAETRKLMEEYSIPLDRIVPERRLVHPGVEGDLFGGTMDFQAIGDEVLLIADLKFGRRQVYADSSQLTAYSLLSLSALPAGHSIKKVIQVIIQPRGNPQVSVHEVGQLELGELWASIKQAEAHILANPDLSVRASHEFLNPGPHCKYCPVRNGCPAREAMASEAMTTGVFMHPDTKKPIVSPTFDVDTDTLVYWHERADALVEFLSDVKKALMTRAAQGEKIPGHKVLVTWGNRAWIDGEENGLRRLLATKGFGLKKKDIYVSKPLSVAQIEKVLKERELLKDPDLKEKFNKLVESKVAGVRLANEKARGEAVRPETIIEFLKDIKEEVDDE